MASFIVCYSSICECPGFLKAASYFIHSWQVGVLKKLGLLVPSYTARTATLSQQQQQQQLLQLPQGQDQERNGAQQQEQQQKLEGVLAELWLVLQVLENCTFTCVENENELLQLKVHAPDAACTLPAAAGPTPEGPCTSAAASAPTTSAESPSFLSALLELVKLLGQLTGGSQAPTVQLHEAAPSSSAHVSKLNPAQSPSSNRPDAPDLLQAPAHGAGAGFTEALAVKRGCQECLHLQWLILDGAQVIDKVLMGSWPWAITTVVVL
eukprot:scaffold50565_cov20-Tisochrysis_lutea.AAC.1